jgi:hypothetical protein
LIKKKDLEIHLEVKTIREIAKEVPMLFRDVSKIIKEYERKKRLQAKREENNEPNEIKKLSLTSQAFNLFVEDKKPIDVTIELILIN